VLSLQRILVASDFSDISEHALDYALELARAFRGSVVLMHAYEIPVVGFPDGVLIASASTATQIETAAEEALRAQAQRRSASDVRIDSVLRQGPVADQVNQAVDELKVDLVVIGTHGRRGIAHAILGSVAERIVRTATRPVLVLREGAVAGSGTGPEPKRD
jgi:nucleotide-binding universal stress UspA family protein